MSIRKQDGADAKARPAADVQRRELDDLAAHVEDLARTLRQLTRRACPYLAGCWLNASAKYRRTLGSPDEDYEDVDFTPTTGSRKSKDQALSSVLFLVLLRQELDALRARGKAREATLVEAAYLPETGRTDRSPPFVSFCLNGAALTAGSPWPNLGVQSVETTLKRTVLEILEDWWTRFHADAPSGEADQSVHRLLAWATLRPSAFDVLRIERDLKPPHREEEDFVRWRGGVVKPGRKRRGRPPKTPPSAEAIKPTEAQVRAFVKGTLDDRDAQDVARYLVLEQDPLATAHFLGLASPVAELWDRVLAVAAQLTGEVRSLVSGSMWNNGALVPATLGQDLVLGLNDEVVFEAQPATNGEHVAAFVRVDAGTLERVTNWRPMPAPTRVLRYRLDHDEDQVDVIIAVVGGVPPVSDSASDAVNMLLARRDARLHTHRISRGADRAHR
jgi:hypothetical protein